MPQSPFIFLIFFDGKDSRELAACITNEFENPIPEANSFVKGDDTQPP
jgi:hypothetical protein